MTRKRTNSIISLLQAPSLLLVFLGTAHASDLVTWSVVDKNADDPNLLPVSKSSSSVSASPVTMGPGLSLNGSSSGWRLKGHTGDSGYVEFKVTTGSLNQVSLESLTFIVRAQAGSGTGEWLSPAITLEYSMDPEFTTSTSAGTLSLGGDLTGGASSAYGDYITSTADSFFTAPLVINPEETYFFRLRASGAGSDAEKNQIMYRDTENMKLTGTITSTATGLVWAGADGANWNTTEENFTDEGAPSLFASGDDVVFKTSGAVEVDPAGIIAGTVYVTAGSSSDTVALQGGNLTATNIFKAGNSYLKFIAPMSASVENTVIEGGRIILDYDSSPEVPIGATYSTTYLTLAGGGQLYIENPPVIFNTNNPVTLGAGGGQLRTNTGITLSIPGLTSSPDFPGTNFIKAGSGSLTISGPVGTVGTSPVDLDFNGGLLTFDGAFDVAITNASESNNMSGSMFLNGTNLVLHQVLMDGNEDDFVTIGDEATKISAYPDAGENLIGVPIVLNTNLTVDSPFGNNAITFDEDISGSGSLIKTGGGEVILTNKTSFSGLTSITEGSFTVAGAFKNGGTLGSGPVNIAAAATLNLDRSGLLSVTNKISGAGNLNVIGSTSIFGGVSSLITLGSENDHTGVTQLLEGNVAVPVLADGNQPSSLGAGDVYPSFLVLKGGVKLSYTGPEASTNREFTLGSGGATIAANGSGPLSFTSTYGVAPDGTGSADRVLTFAGTAPGISSFAMDVANGVSSVHAVTKEGPNTWALTGINTYSGPTNVTGGILRIDGDSTAAIGPITVSSGGALGGNGISGASALIESDGGLAVAISDWTGAAGTGYDDLQLLNLNAGSVPMTLNIDTTGMVNFADAGQSFAILNATAGITNFDPANVTISAPGFPGTGSWSLAAAGDSLVLSYIIDTYHIWITSYGLSGEDAEPGTDYDKDGLSNEDEYAFGLDPTSAASASPIKLPLDKASGIFTYSRIKPLLTGLAYTYESSSTLQGFEPFSAISEESDDGHPVEIITVTVPSELLENSSLFVRVTAQ